MVPPWVSGKFGESKNLIGDGIPNQPSPDGDAKTFEVKKNAG